MSSELLNSLSQSFELAKNESILCIIGPLQRVINHEQSEWSLTYQWITQETYPELGFTKGKNADFSDTQDNLHRYAYGDDTNLLSLSPKLADRSIVARPRAPLNLVAGQNVWFYISSPV